ncbi:NAD(P)-dependent oxidoreductase [Halobellus sp. GM3]|uniref:NAD(P)-dependent oxidoreductase n=1 Tax=Halobellus sp. GM3 TaxID=3458410 RepID=UPI00403E019B
MTVVDESTLDGCDAVVTLGHDDTFIETVQWVHEIRSGYDDYPLAEYDAAGVLLTNSTGLPTDMVAETTIGYLLSLARGLHSYHGQQEDQVWERIPWKRPFTIGSSSACVVGMGQIGSGIATRAAALGMDVTGVDIRPVNAHGVDRVYDVRRLQEALTDVRFVVLSMPLTEETRGLVGESEFEAMRDDAFLINASRGEIVDQRALEVALETDEIAGAALDVFEEEPLPADSPLWEMEEVIVTPHMAGQANHFHELVADLVETNVSRLSSGEEPWNRVV